MYCDPRGRVASALPSHIMAASLFTGLVCLHLSYAMAVLMPREMCICVTIGTYSLLGAFLLRYYVGQAMHTCLLDNYEMRTLPTHNNWTNWIYLQKATWELNWRANLNLILSISILLPIASALLLYLWVFGGKNA
ncbi:unnamed protein product [Mesocestoides corti]|uniref:Transmembrane 9 superfamily member n=1 Tax=Mesocestoides corti TaxID=53468 RepID=A0A0R3UJ19_MESCO|nr:unnamed protein product [Mesocestoides corti]